MSRGTLTQSISPTVFTSVPATSKKNNYSRHDVRLLRCFSPACKKKNSNSPKIFHHVCFMHMLKTVEEEKMEMIKISSAHDKILDFVGDHVDISCLKNFSSDDLSNLIFPFCGQRCFNYILNYRTKKNPAVSNGDSEYAASCSWDSDGSSKKRTSIQVLIDWFTTEENCSSYFGGVDEQGKTNGNRKDTYHYHIRDLIRNENGKYIYVLIKYLYLMFYTFVNK